MQAEFGISAVTASEARVELRLEGMAAGTALTRPAARVMDVQAQGIATGDTWSLEAAEATAAYSVALPAALDRPTAHGAALAQAVGGGLVATLAAILPGLPAECPVACREAAGLPFSCGGGMLVAAPGLERAEVEASETRLSVAVLPAEGELVPPVRLARWASRWAAFRMGMPAAELYVLAAPASTHLAFTPPTWSQVDRAGTPEQIAHGLMHGTGLCARPATTAEWWAHEGIADYCGRVELARMSAEGDRRLHEWLKTAYAANRQPAIAPAEASGEQLTTLGALVAHVLSSQLLGFTGSSRSIFHLVEALNSQFGAAEAYTNDDLVALLYKLSGREFGGFMARHVYGTEPLPEAPFAKL